MALKIGVGYWFSREDEESSRFIEPHALVDHDWHAQDRDKIVHYLKSGVEYVSYLGYSHCRFEDGPPCHEMGCRDLTDGVWVWPEGLYVYVERYHIRLPEQFYEHMKRNDFTVPGATAIDLKLHGGYICSYEFWIAWGKQQIGHGDGIDLDSILQETMATDTSSIYDTIPRLKGVFFDFLKDVADYPERRAPGKTSYSEGYNEFMFVWFNVLFPNPDAWIELEYLTPDEVNIISTFHEAMKRLSRKFKNNEPADVVLIANEPEFINLVESARLTLQKLSAYDAWRAIEKMHHSAG
ncbi:MAG: hypothetical protein ABFD69_09535 [Candidatus Sumerlaeia bacterium]